MKTLSPLLFIVLSLLLLSSPATAQEQSPAPRFAASTAHTLDPGRIETGLFGPTRFGLTDRLELQGHPILFFLAPNLRLRAHLFAFPNTTVSLTQGLTYPTFLLNTLAMEGAGGILPPDRPIPQILSSFTELTATYNLNDHLLTAALGLQFAPRFGDNELVSIDLPYVFPRTAAFFNTATLIPRVHVQGPITGPLGYSIDARFFSSLGSNSTYSIEQSTRLRLNLSERWLLQAGLMITHGQYPFGTDTRLLPIADILWAVR